MGTQEVGEDIPLALACAETSVPGKPASPCAFDLLLTGSRARSPVKFKVQFKALESTVPPSCGVNRTGLSTEEGAAVMVLLGSILRQASWWRRRPPSSWCWPSKVPAFWAGWCWLSSPHHVQSSSGSQPPGSGGSKHGAIRLGPEVGGRAWPAAFGSVSSPEARSASLSLKKNPSLVAGA